MGIKENRVVDLMVTWLEDRGYQIKSTAHDTQQGHDIAATRNGKALYVECKGSQGGKDFSKHAKFNSAASAFFNQMRLRETESQSEVGIALPDDDWYRELMQKLTAFCKRNSVRVFWVSENLVSEWE
jgi:hypothetical protein